MAKKPTPPDDDKGIIKATFTAKELAELKAIAEQEGFGDSVSALMAWTMRRLIIRKREESK